MSELKFKLPESLEGMPCDWTQFEPFGGWPFHECLQTQLVAEFEKRHAVFKAKRDSFNRLVHDITEFKRQAADIGERFGKWLEFCEATVLPDGSNFTSVLRDLNDGAEDRDPKGDTVPFDKCLHTFGGILAMADRFGQVGRSDMAESEKAKAEVENQYIVTGAFVEFFRRFFDDCVFAYAIQQVPIKFKTKVLREAYRNASSGMACLAVLDQKGQDLLKSLVEKRKEGQADIWGDIRKAFEMNFKLEKRVVGLVKSGGVSVWEAAEKRGGFFGKTEAAS